MGDALASTLIERRYSSVRWRGGEVEVRLRGATLFPSADFRLSTFDFRLSTFDF